MMHLICNRTSKDYFEKLLSLLEPGKNKRVFIYSPEDLESAFFSFRPKSGLVVIETPLSWSDKNLQDFQGFDIAASLRRDYFLKLPIIFFSPVREEFVVERIENAGLLKAQGSRFLSFPVAPESIKRAFLDRTVLSDLELKEVVIKYCGLKKEWRSISHILGACLQSYPERKNEVSDLIKKWAKTINYFAPLQWPKIIKIQELLASSSTHPDELKLLKQKLDQGLIDNNDDSLAHFFEYEPSVLPNCPPEGFLKILIADDEPLDFLISGLQNEYHYEIIGQAKGLNEAERLLNDKKPDIVLSDFYFKKYVHELLRTKSLAKYL